ncbi:MAG: hypothetical protein KA981_12015 [Bacteroidia bacterium]|nr:hypothetical protein [Bacteroidia bacterium]
MNTEIKILKAMLLLAESLNYSDTYKASLIKEIKSLIEIEIKITPSFS